MPGPFAITAATNTIRLDDKRGADTQFTVFNNSGRPIRGRARIVAQNPAAQGWITLVGEPERDFAIAGAQQYSLHIAVPPTAPAGSYPFRLDVVGVDNPDDDLSEGPTVQFEVPAPVAKKAGFPWWILLVIAAILAVIVVAIFLLRPEPTPTPMPTATATATVPPPTITSTPTFAPSPTPSVTPTPNPAGRTPLFNFADTANSADWVAGPPDVPLGWGSGPESAGTILWESGMVLSDGTHPHSMLVHAQPNINNGYLQGCYQELYNTAYVVKQGDLISGTLSFFQGGTNTGDVNFKIVIRADGLPDAEIMSLPIKYADGTKTFVQELGGQYANRRATFCLRVEAGQSAVDDQFAFYNLALLR